MLLDAETRDVIIFDFCAFWGAQRGRAGELGGLRGIGWVAIFFLRVQEDGG